MSQAPPTAKPRCTAPQLLESPENSPRHRPIVSVGNSLPSASSNSNLPIASSADDLHQSNVFAQDAADLGEVVTDAEEDPLNAVNNQSFNIDASQTFRKYAAGRRRSGAVHLGGGLGSSGGLMAEESFVVVDDADFLQQTARGRTSSLLKNNTMASGTFDMIDEKTITENWSMARRFGFPCSMVGEVVEAEHNFYPRMIEQNTQCEEKWNNAVRGVQLLANATPEGTEPLRKLSRKYGIPSHLRGIIWLTLSGTAIKMEENPDFCALLLQRHGYMTGEPEQTITKDLERTFPDHPFFDLREMGSIKLKHVLHSLCWRNPLLNYCQSFNFLAAVLLLILDDEEATFWMMAHILENLLPNDYYGEGLMGLKVDQEVTIHLLWEYLPKVAQHFQHCNFDVRALVPAWVMSLYVNIFPIETTVRVWDYILTHDAKLGMPASPLTITLAVLKIHQDEILKLDDASDILVNLGKWTQVMFDGNKLVKTANDFKLAPSALHSLRRHYKGQIIAENNLRMAMKQARLQERAKKDAVTAELLANQSIPNADAATGGVVDGGAASPSSSDVMSPAPKVSDNTGGHATAGFSDSDVMSPASPSVAPYNTGVGNQYAVGAAPSVSQSRSMAATAHYDPSTSPITPQPAAPRHLAPSIDPHTGAVEMSDFAPSTTASQPVAVSSEDGGPC